jgi:hypothetical protein
MSVEEAILELHEKSGAENNVDSGVKRGEAPLYKIFPLPLGKGKGDKGGWG